MLEAYLPRRRPGYWALDSEADGRGIPDRGTARRAAAGSDRSLTGVCWRTKCWRRIARRVAECIGPLDGRLAGGIEQAQQPAPGLQEGFQNECRSVVDANVANLTVRTLRGLCSPFGSGGKRLKERRFLNVMPAYLLTDAL